MDLNWSFEPEQIICPPAQPPAMALYEGKKVG